jgi:hypothetical protein
MQIIDRDLFENKVPADVQGLLDGDVKAIVPVRYMPSFQVRKNLDECLLANNISSVDITTHEIMVVLAQADQEKEGKELDARYYHHGEHDYPDVKDPHGRVGQLLGFTENDIAWFSGTKYQNPIINKLMMATQDIRTQARKEAMIMEREDNSMNTSDRLSVLNETEKATPNKPYGL